MGDRGGKFGGGEGKEGNTLVVLACAVLLMNMSVFPGKEIVDCGGDTDIEENGTDDSDLSLYS